MMGLDTIKRMSDEAAARASELELKPLLVEFDDQSDDDVFANMRRIPDLGSMDVEGYTEVERFFVDSSGFGDDNEPALTIAQFVDEARGLSDDPNFDTTGGLFFAIVQAGQFQVYIAAYTKEVS